MKSMKPLFPIAAVLCILTGCSSYRTVPLSDLRTETEFEDVRVATIEGYEYRFTRAVILADTLEGFYPVTVERSSGKNEVWYEDVLRRHPIALDRVLKVELIRRDPVKTGFYGATLAAAGFFLVTLVDEPETEPKRTGSVIKNPPGGGIR